MGNFFSKGERPLELPEPTIVLFPVHSIIVNYGDAVIASESPIISLYSKKSPTYAIGIVDDLYPNLVLKGIPNVMFPYARRLEESYWTIKCGMSPLPIYSSYGFYASF